MENIQEVRLLNGKVDAGTTKMRSKNNYKGLKEGRIGRLQR